MFMKKLNWPFFAFSFVVAVVVMYIVMIRQDGATQEQAWMNAFGGGVGMVIGLFIYYKYIKKDDDNYDLND